MERRLTIRGASTSPITVLAYNPGRREIVTGHEDGALKCWETDTGHHVTTLSRHRGWVTDLLYWSDGKVLISSSVDGTIVQWSSAGVAYNTIDLGSPVYSMLRSPKKEQPRLIIGRNGYIGVLSTSGKFGLPVLEKKECRIDGHTDIVRCLATLGNKVFSAGYDNKLIIYDVTSIPKDDDLPLTRTYTNHTAHEAGITCLLVAKDTDSSTWIATGSFDMQVKIWTADGRLIHSLQCSYPVTGICYVPQVRVLWVSAGTTMATLFEPKSGDLVSEYVPVLGDDPEQNTGNKVLHLLKYSPDTHEVIGSTSRKEVLTWRYSHSCCVCVQKLPEGCQLETLSFTRKSPILIFSGSYDGKITKWERMQLNPFMYSQEGLSYQEKLASHLDNTDGEKKMFELVHREHNGGSVSDLVKQEAKQEIMKAEYRGFLKSVFVESVDYLVASTMDGKIFVWGYDNKTTKLLGQLVGDAQLEPNETDVSAEDPTGNDADMCDDRDELEARSLAEKLLGLKVKESPIADRVAGFTCLYILDGHKASVPALAVVEHVIEGPDLTHKVYLLSAGWDQTICLWDLKNGSLIDQLTDCFPPSDATSEDGDRIITDIAYNSTDIVFAYAASDHVVYLRKFSERAADMKLIGKLTGHTAEVLQVHWNNCGKWITGSEDGTIRVWAQLQNESPYTCEQMVSTGGPITTMCIDEYGSIIAGVKNILKVYDANLELVQVSKGHTDSIKAVIYIQKLKQYVSAGWDCTIRIWNAYQKPSLPTLPNKMARNRWHVAYTLLRNPTLQPKTASRMQQQYMNEITTGSPT